MSEILLSKAEIKDVVIEKLCWCGYRYYTKSKKFVDLIIKLMEKDMLVMHTQLIEQWILEHDIPYLYKHNIGE